MKRLKIFKFLNIVLFISCIACNNSIEKDSDDRIEVDVIHEISLNVSEPLMNPDYPFPPYQTITNKDSILIFNQYILGITSLKYKDSKLESVGSKEVIQIKNILIDRPDYFFFINNNVVFIQNNLMIFTDKNFELDYAIDLRKYYPLKEWSIPYFRTSNNFELGNSSNSYDEENKQYYFFSKDLLGDYLELLKYDIKLDSVIIIKEFYDKSWIKLQEIKHRNEGVFTVDNFPFLTFHKNLLITSYYSNSKIDIFDTKSNKSFSWQIESQILAEKKSIPPQIPANVSSIDAIEYTLDWEREVAYGEIKYWETCNCFFRTIKGPSEKEIKNYDVFIQFFDNNFKLIEELNLSKVSPKISTFSLPLKNVILFKSRVQNSEDEYLFIEVNFKFKE